MHFTIRAVLTVTGSLLLQGGCVDEQKQADQIVATSPPAPPTSKRMGRVAKNWQLKFQKKMADENGSAAFMLVSESGFADIGQFLVIESGSVATLHLVKAAGKTMESPRKLTDAEWKDLAEQVEKAGALADVEVTQFDGTRYEYVQFTRPDSAAPWQEGHRVFISTPQFDQTTQAHKELIQAFQALHP